MEDTSVSDSDSNAVILAERLRERVARARAEANLSQTLLEAELGLPSGAFSKIESGARSLASTELATLARLTGRHVGWFFEEDPAPVPLLRGSASSIAGKRDLAWLHEFAKAYCFLKSEFDQNTIVNPGGQHVREKGGVDMSKRQRVNFIAEKPQPTKVSFRTEDGQVSFVARKPQPTEVSFLAKKK